jgi:hypothetical protein
VIGLKLPSGVLEATRVIVYESGAPVPYEAIAHRLAERRDPLKRRRDGWNQRCGTGTDRNQFHR